MMLISRFSRSLRLVTALTALFCLLVTLPAHAGPINAKSAILVDVTTGRTLYEQHADQRIPPASLTKVMSMYVAMNAISTNRTTYNKKVKVSAEAARTGGSTLNLRKGESVTLDKLFYGMAVASGNDASVAVAEHISGSQAAFVKEMNALARKLGMSRTTFRNVHGLPIDGQFTTARDMMKLAKSYQAHYPKARRYHLAKNVTHNGHTEPNHNPLVGYYHGLEGLKTGWITAAGYNIIVTARRNGHKLIGVILGAPNTQTRAIEARRLLNAGFSSIAKKQKNANAELGVSTKQAAQLKKSPGYTPAAPQPKKQVIPDAHIVASGDTLSGIALKYGISVKDILDANGGQNKLKVLRVGQKIQLPGEPAPKPEPKKARPDAHIVASGDTLSGIALKYGISVKDIQDANGGQNKLKVLRVGQKIQLPGEPAPKPEPKKARPDSHIVASGDTLSGIALKYGISVKDIQDANGGQNKLKVLRVGQKIQLPGEPAPKPEPKKARPDAHIVASGDTLSGIALKYGISVKDIQDANGGQGKLKVLRVGQKIQLPGEPAPEPAPKPVPKKVIPAVHVVANGDTLARIALKYGVTIRELRNLNEGLDSADVLHVGQELKLREDIVEAQDADDEFVTDEEESPRAALPVSHTVASGDSLTSIARQYGISLKVLQDINGGPDQLKTLSVGQKLVLPY